MKQTPHRVKEERFPPAAVKTMPLNQAAVTLARGGGRGGFSLGPAVGRGGLEDVAPLPHIVSALFLSFPPLLSPSVASVCSRLRRVCVARINGAPFRIYLSNYFQELRTDKFALSCAVFAAKPPLPAMKGGSF